MGISQLLPFLEKSTTQCHVSKFRGTAVAVDTYCWLHKGARGCATQLVKGENPDGYIQYCLKYIKLLLSYDIRPIMVFDGRHLPAKMGTEEKRREAKIQARKQGMEYLRLGKQQEAYKYFCQCVEVTPKMALGLMNECHKLHVDCIVAPYESDAQLAFFSLRGMVSCIISEDSDLLVFGCQKVLYKMDLTGNGQLVEADKIHLSMKQRQEQFDFGKFRHMCILSGCDYIDSLPGIGLKKAMKFITMTAETDPEIFIDRIPRYLKMKTLTIPPDYKEKFLIADATFKYQIVYNPLYRSLVPLHDMEMQNITHCKNAGEVFDLDQAFQLAIGNLNPLTMEKIGNWNPDGNIISHYSIWSPDYRVFARERPESAPRPQSSITKPPNPDPPILNETHDKQVEKELEFYKTTSTANTSIKEIPPTATSDAENETSPVLGTNPFLKQKLSKFQPTSSNTSPPVVSRYFNQNGPERLWSLKERTMPILPTTVKFVDVHDPANYINLEKIRTIIGLENQKPCLEVLQDPDDGRDDIELPNVECECILVVEDRVLEFPDSPPALQSVENIKVEVAGPKMKRRRIEKPKKGEKQMTLDAVFKRMKKS